MDYDGIPTAVLFCHVCQKHMWDGAVSYSLMYTETQLNKKIIILVF